MGADGAAAVAEICTAAGAAREVSSGARGETAKRHAAIARNTSTPVAISSLRGAALGAGRAAFWGALGSVTGCAMWGAGDVDRRERPDVERDGLDPEITAFTTLRAVGSGMPAILIAPRKVRGIPSALLQPMPRLYRAQCAGVPRSPPLERLGPCVEHALCAIEVPGPEVPQGDHRELREIPLPAVVRPADHRVGELAAGGHRQARGVPVLDRALERPELPREVRVELRTERNEVLKTPERVRERRVTHGAERKGWKARIATVRAMPG